MSSSLEFLEFRIGDTIGERVENIEKLSRVLDRTWFCFCNSLIAILYFSISCSF
jgi:hypothetical protein